MKGPQGRVPILFSTGEALKAQRGYVTRPKSHSWATRRAAVVKSESAHCPVPHQTRVWAGPSLALQRALQPAKPPPCPISPCSTACMATESRAPGPGEAQLLRPHAASSRAAIRARAWQPHSQSQGLPAAAPFPGLLTLLPTPLFLSLRE